MALFKKGTGVAEGRRVGHGGTPETNDRGVTPPTSAEHLETREAAGDIDTSPDAARKVAQKIEDGGGFWGPRKDR